MFLVLLPAVRLTISSPMTAFQANSPSSNQFKKRLEDGRTVTFTRIIGYRKEWLPNGTLLPTNKNTDYVQTPGNICLEFTISGSLNPELQNVDGLEVSESGPGERCKFARDNYLIDYKTEGYHLVASTIVDRPAARTWGDVNLGIANGKFELVDQMLYVGKNRFECFDAKTHTRVAAGHSRSLSEGFRQLRKRVTPGKVAFSYNISQTRGINRGHLKVRLFHEGKEIKISNMSGKAIGGAFRVEQSWKVRLKKGDRIEIERRREQMVTFENVRYVPN